MKKKKNDKDRLKEQSLIRKKLKAKRKRRHLARLVVPPELELTQAEVNRIVRPGKKQRDRDRRNGKRQQLKP